MKVSIITVSYNSRRTLTDTINSVLHQSHSDIEYILVDGGSTDGTTDIIESFGSRISKYITEPDKGMYDALNKGIKMASGDIVGILNSDDFFYDNFVVEKITRAFDEVNIEAVYGDVQFVDPVKTSKVLRYYSSKKFNTDKFRFGFMPAHPSFYLKRALFEKFGYYKTDYKIAADFELMVRYLLINKINIKYLEMPFISMRTGGMSNKSVLSRLTLNNEILRACKENGIRTNPIYVYSKYFSKIFDFFDKRVTG